MMRLDESRIPKGGGVKIRCPRCKEIDYVEDPSLSKKRGATPQQEAGSKVESRTTKGPEPSLPSASAKNDPSRGGEPTIPDDAFQGFRFPAERERNSSSKKMLSVWVKFVIWAIVSLAVVAFFALLVNVVLSGPAGTKPFVSGKPPGSVQRQAP